MPWAVRKSGKKWIVEKKSGEKVAEHATQGDAEAQVRLLYATEHGWKPTGKPRKK